MTKKGIIYCVLAVLLTAYLVVGLIYSNRMAAADHYRRLDIHVAQSQVDFVNANDIDQELGGLRGKIAKMRIDSVNTLAIERTIMAMDNIEQANCVALNNGVLRLDVVPLMPIARVFDTAEEITYYINRLGKRMQATNQFRIDAPVVVGDFTGKAQPTDVVPVLDYLEAHPHFMHLTSMLQVTRKGDIMLVPRMRGHIVNLGDTADLSNKFDRLLAFYRQAMPVKGWEYYDTISVKWRGQVVAKRKGKTAKLGPALEDDESDIDDIETMAPVTPAETAALERLEQQQTQNQ